MTAGASGRWRTWIVAAALQLTAATLGACAGHDPVPARLARAEWIVAVDEGADPARVAAPAADTPCGPGSPELASLRELAGRLEPQDGMVLWKGHRRAVVGTASGERLRLRISVYGGFFLAEDTGERFQVAARDREAWHRLMGQLSRAGSRP